MIDKDNPANENSPPQTPNQLNWNLNAFGLDPFYIWEQIKAGFTKTISHLFGWDYIDLIWRGLSVDSNGNLRVSNGTQSANAPLQRLVTVTSTPSIALPFNPARSGFSIYNNAPDNTFYAREIIVSYPNVDENFNVFIPVGYVYTDNNWQGTVSLSIGAADINVNVIIVEI